MAEMGFTSLNEIVGQTQWLDKQQAIDHWKVQGLEFNRLFYKPDVPDDVSLFNNERQTHHIDNILDRKFIQGAKPALDGVHHDAKMPSQHLPCRHRDARPRPAQAFHRHTRASHQLLLFCGRIGARADGGNGFHLAQ